MEKKNTELMVLTPGDVILSLENNPNPKQYELFWEQKGFRGVLLIPPTGKIYLLEQSLV